METLRFDDTSPKRKRGTSDAKCLTSVLGHSIPRLRFGLICHMSAGAKRYSVCLCILCAK
jgi:hypothetical protein